MNKESLYKFFNGDASQAEEKKILDWLGESPSNRKELLRERKIFDTVLLSDRESADIAGSKPLRRSARWAKEVLKIAAVLAIVVAGGYYFVSERIGKMSAMSNTITVPAGQRVNVTLPDGSNVWLNSLSDISYPAVFRGGERRVKLSGEAFFDVAHDPNNPFVVETQMYDITVLGTKFNVVSLPERNEFSTSVIEGRVRVTDRSDPDIETTLTQNLEGTRISDRLMMREIADMDIFLWKEGIMSFRNESLANLLDRFRKSFDVKIVFDAKELPGHEFSGKFRMSDGVFHALRVLQRDARFSYQWDEQQNIIYISKGN